MRRHLTDLRFCCASKVPSASKVREPDAYRDCSNRLLDGAAIKVIAALTPSSRFARSGLSGLQEHSLHGTRTSLAIQSLGRSRGRNECTWTSDSTRSGPPQVWS